MNEPRLKLTLHTLSAAAEKALQDRPLPPELGKRQYRRTQAAVSKGGYDAATKTISMSVSSETPIARYGGYEILSHAAGALDTSRLDAGIPLLYNHDWDKLIGRSQSYELDGGMLRIINKFATNAFAREREQDVADGILVDVSIGYQPLQVDITEDKDGIRTFTIPKWMLYENSLVTVPADFSVGVNRSAGEDVAEVEITFRKFEADDPDDPDEDEEDDDEDEEDDDERKQRAAAASTTPSEPSTTQPPQQRTNPMAEVNADLAQQNKERITGLRSLRTEYADNFSETQFMDAVTGETTVEQARKLIVDTIIAKGKSSEIRTVSEEVVGSMSGKEKRIYSLRNAIVATINQRAPGTFKDKGSEAGFEREVSDEMAKTLGRRGVSASSGNILIPSDMGRRSLQAGGNAGSTTINTQTSSDVIDLLRPRCRVLGLGASEIMVDTGLLRLPRQTGTSSSQWLAELAGSTNTDMSFDTISFSPKRNGIFGSYTLELLSQSAISVEARVRADQLASKARTYDAVTLVGTGANGMPLGLLNMTGLALILTGSSRAANGAVTAGVGGAPVSWVDLNNFEAAISNVNGDTGTLGWMYTPRVRAAMRSTAKFPGTGGYMPILPDSPTDPNGLQDGPLGYKAGVTTNGLPTNGSANSVNNLHTMILGVWANLIIANWGVSELVYDNITGAKQGIFNIIENEFMDVNCSHIEGFAASTTVLPS